MFSYPGPEGRATGCARFESANPLIARVRSLCDRSASPGGVPAGFLHCCPVRVLLRALRQVRVRLTRTMLRLNRAQRNLIAQKLCDEANVAAGALIFGQFLADRFSIALVISGVVAWSA